MADEIQSDLPDDLQQFESLLRGCTPSTPRLDRDRVMYLAGRASVEAAIAEEMLAFENPSTQAEMGRAAEAAAGIVAPAFRNLPHKPNHIAWTWPLTSAALLLLSLTLGAAILFRRAETRIVYVTEPAAPSVAALAALTSDPAKQSAAANSELNYLKVRNLVLAQGVEALPDNYPTASSHRSEEPRVTPLSRQDF